MPQTEKARCQPAFASAGLMGWANIFDAVRQFSHTFSEMAVSNSCMLALSCLSKRISLILFAPASVPPPAPSATAQSHLVREGPINTA